MSPINLIPAYRIKAWQRKRRLQFWLVVILVYALVSMSGAMAVVGIMDKDLGGLAELMSGAEEQIQIRRDRIADLEPQIAEQHAILEATEVVTGQPDWSLLLALIANQQGSDIMLWDYRLKPATAAVAPRTFQLQLQGIGRAQTNVSSFVLRLEKLNLFDRVKVIHTSRRSDSSVEVVEFQLMCVLGAEQ